MIPSFAPTARPQDVLRERHERIEAKMALLRELETYLENVRAKDRVPEVEIEA